LGWVWVSLVIGFIYAPILVVIGASVDPGHYVMNRAYLQFPPQGFTLYWYFHVAPALWRSVLVSVELASAVTVGAVLLGVPAALGLLRGQFPGRNAVAALFRTPLQIPFIVTGVAFLQTFNTVAAASGIALQASFTGLCIAHLFVATPYVVGAAGSALARLSPRLDEAALSLGASRWRTFRRVTLPLITPAVFGGAMFAFLVSFTDVTIALFLTPEDGVTFPVWVYGSIQNDLETSMPAVSSMVFLASGLMIVLLQRLIGMETVLRGGGAKG
jgi:putative spermidine/putrescine transport system permease protein